MKLYLNDAAVFPCVWMAEIENDGNGFFNSFVMNLVSSFFKKEKRFL